MENPWRRMQSWRRQLEEAEPQTENGRVTPRLIVGAFHFVQSHAAPDVIRELRIPEGVWAEDLRHIGAFYAAWNDVNSAVALDGLGAGEEPVWAEIEKEGMISVVADVAMHHVEQGASGPEP